MKEVFGKWAVVHHYDTDPKIMHAHQGPLKNDLGQIYLSTNYRSECRICGEVAPKGVRFRALCLKMGLS